MVSGTGQDVCNPCTFSMGRVAGTTAPRKVTVRVDDLIAAKGGFGQAAAKLGYGVIVVGGDDPAGVQLQGFVVNFHTSAFDLSVFGYRPAAAQARLKRPYKWRK